MQTDSKLSRRQTEMEDILKSRQTNIVRPIDGQTCMQTDIQTDKQLVRHTYKQTFSQT